MTGHHPPCSRPPSAPAANLHTVTASTRTRQRHALTHPLNRAVDALRPEYAAERHTRDEWTIRTVLAVDR
jgi:hypothetical protein